MPISDVEEILAELRAMNEVDLAMVISRSGMHIAGEIPEQAHSETFVAMSAILLGAAETATRSGDPRLILVHVEVEGRFRSAHDQKILRYYMHLRLKYSRPVISICVNLKGSPVGVKVRQVVEKVGAMEVCRFSYLAFGLSRCLAEEYIDRPQALAPALAALMRSKWR